jgi:hypothetical protein
MSFKLFIYYSALCGGWAGLLGWGLGQALTSNHESTERTTLKMALTLGILVALAVGLVDAWWNRPRHDWMGMAVTAGMAGVVGCVGGLLGAQVGLLLVNFTGSEGVLQTVFAIMGWTIVGLAVGASVGLYDLLIHFFHKKSLAGALRKVRHGLLGGALGGLVGSLLYVILKTGLGAAFGRETLRAPSAIGFTALGLFIGLLIGLAQIILREAWIKVETGFRAGREMMLSKEETTIGRAESCDLGLFGDQAIERVHARILQQGSRYVLADADTPTGTYLNEQRINLPAPLHAGDTIGIGNSLLRFGERQKRIKTP